MGDWTYLRKQIPRWSFTLFHSTDPNEGDYYRWWQVAKQFAWEKLIRQALVEGNVDANRLYVFGISEGGYGSQRLASFYADYWAAAGPMLVANH